MESIAFPFSVRFIGFSVDESETIEAAFELDQDKGNAYFRLSDDSLQDPDMYLVNGTDIKSLAILSDLRPNEMRPGLVVGMSDEASAIPHVGCIERPIRWDVLFNELDRLIDKRSEAMARLQASNIVSVPERRRRDRLDVDVTDPKDYISMRRKPLVGGVLIVDKTPVFCQYVAEMLARHQVPVEWAGDETHAIVTCEQQNISIVMINTSTPDIDPYRLCAALKRINSDSEKVVIFLVSKTFVYDSAHAKAAGSTGLLNKPLSINQLLSVLRKFLPLSR